MSKPTNLDVFKVMSKINMAVILSLQVDELGVDVGDTAETVTAALARLESSAERQDADGIVKALAVMATASMVAVLANPKLLEKCLS